MKKVIRLTESDLVRIVQKVLNEQPLTPRADMEKSEPLSPEERANELKKQDAEIKKLEMELEQIKNEIKQARIENIKEAKTKFVSKIKQIIANIDRKIDYKKMEKKGAEVRHLEKTKSRLEDKLRRIETGEDRTPEQKKQIMDTLKEVAFGLGTYISAVFTFIKLREKNPDKFREYGF
jgi:chromosome segregation ATPase